MTVEQHIETIERSLRSVLPQTLSTRILHHHKRPWPTRSSLRQMTKTVTTAALLIFLSGCGTFVPVVNLHKVTPQTLAASKSVKLYMLGQQPPSDFEYIDSITAWSVKHMLYDPPATKGNAIAQAKVICIQKGGNALMNISFDAQGTDTWGTNAWESIALSADVIKIK